METSLPHTCFNIRMTYIFFQLWQRSHVPSIRPINLPRSLRAPALWGQISPFSDWLKMYAINTGANVSWVTQGEALPWGQFVPAMHTTVVHNRARCLLKFMNCVLTIPLQGQETLPNTPGWDTSYLEDEIYPQQLLCNLRDRQGNASPKRCTVPQVQRGEWKAGDSTQGFA